MWQGYWNTWVSDLHLPWGIILISVGKSFIYGLFVSIYGLFVSSHAT
jgi:hypothetical protein